MKLKGSKTDANLKSVLAGEFEAGRRYPHFLPKSDILYIPPKSDIERQTEFVELARSMANEARVAGFDAVADWLGTLAEAEPSHPNHCEKALNEMGRGEPSSILPLACPDRATECRCQFQAKRRASH